MDTRHFAIEINDNAICKIKMSNKKNKKKAKLTRCINKIYGIELGNNPIGNKNDA